MIIPYNPYITLNKEERMIFKCFGVLKRIVVEVQSSQGIQHNLFSGINHMSTWYFYAMGSLDSDGMPWSDARHFSDYFESRV